MNNKETFFRCKNGHIVPESAKFCPWCGESIISENSKEIISKDRNSTIICEPQIASDSSKRTIIYNHNDNDKTIVISKSNKKICALGKLVGFIVSYDIDESGMFFPIHEGREIIGRGSTATIKIEDSQLSKEHAVILYRQGKFIFEDLLSTNGSYINGVDVLEKIELHHSDIIEIGKYKYVFIEIPHINFKLLAINP